ncbi:MAG: hypothetical protein IKB05_00375 [Alphaproteobacteria bacterium]|nr:hypothetical protein [Alphaproteobacteria bacterium]
MKRLIFLMSLAPLSAIAGLANGQNCLYSTQCDSGVCLRTSSLSLATCVAAATLGQTCTSSTLTVYTGVPPCASGFKCGDAGVCILGNVPSTDCPAGYIAIDRPYITLATSCPSGTIAIGTAESCLVSSPSGDCIMYAPAGESYTDDTGIYEFTDACAME